ncbi:MAG: UvrD-helicase domain-containing protein [Xanthomonadales bacterium]|nr:UvrD-helicase domain-containing protein [Xanthomonadales bacterium]
MGHVDIDLRAIERGTVTAPAGCGKTQLIAHALAGHRGNKPILVLTHTNAGVAALRGRLDRAGVPASAYRLSTIDGWAIRLISTFPGRSAHDPEILRLAAPARDYPAIRDAAWKLLQAGHVSEVLKASYAHLIVDEYQDCSVTQHHVIYFLSLILPTCVLGDPMQAIFGFRGNALADWNQHVCAHFPVIGELATPWRWRNAGAEVLGQWLLEARRLLAAGQSVDLRSGPPEHVTWVQAVPPNDHTQRLAAARTAPPTADGRVLIIADSRNRAAQQNFASQTPGASTVEAVDLQDLIAFASGFDAGAPNALAQLLALAQSVMTNVGVAELTRRLESLAKGTVRNPPNEAESRALAFRRTPSLAAAAALLSELRALPNVRVHRPAILYGVLKALREASSGAVPLTEAARRVREENRLLGRPLPKRAVGSTLLLKGLEAEVAVLLNIEGMSAQNLYVAMTRGSMKLVVCSTSPVIG